MEAIEFGNCLVSRLTSNRILDLVGLGVLLDPYKGMQCYRSAISMAPNVTLVDCRLIQRAFLGPFLGINYVSLSEGHCLESILKIEVLKSELLCIYQYYNFAIFGFLDLLSCHPQVFSYEMGFIAFLLQRTVFTLEQSLYHPRQI